MLLGSLIKTAGSSCPDRGFFFLEIYRRRPSSKEEENTFIYHHTIPSQLVKKETETSRSVYRYCFSPIIKTYFWCFFASFLIERLMRRARMICIFKFDWGYLQGVLLDFGVIVSPFPSVFFNVGMDIRSSSTDLTVLLISLDSQTSVLRNNKTRTSVVQPLPSLTMCTSQKSPLFLQLIISSIHTRQRVCETASLQRAIYHLSQEQRLQNTRGTQRKQSRKHMDGSELYKGRVLLVTGLCNFIYIWVYLHRTQPAHPYLCKTSRTQT